MTKAWPLTLVIGLFFGFSVSNQTPRNFGHFVLDSSLIAQLDPVGKPRQVHQHKLF